MVVGLVAAVPAVIAAAVPAASQTPQSSVLSYGEAPALGGPASLNAPVVGMAATPDGGGYWLLGADGGVFNYGDAAFEGSGAGSGYRFVGISATPDGRGYVLTDTNGDVKGYGTAQLFGSIQQQLNASVVGIAETPDGRGYWLAAADGGVFAFGDAPFLGSLAGLASSGAAPLNAPIVGIAATPDGDGYWLVAADGGVFAFGDAQFYGSEGGAAALNVPVVGMAATPSGRGYWLAAGDGGIFTFGDAVFAGSAGASPPPHPVAGVAASHDGGGYWLATSVTGPTPVPMQPQVDAGCYTPAVQPATIVLACADYNSLLENLQWTYWQPTLARATGTYTYNACEQSCAEGSRVSLPTTLWLSQPVSTSAGVEFSHAHWVYPTGQGPTGFSGSDQTLFTDP